MARPRWLSRASAKKAKKAQKKVDKKRANNCRCSTCARGIVRLDKINCRAARGWRSALQHDGWGEEDVSATTLKRLDLPAAARGSLAVDLGNRFPVAMAQLARGSMGAQLRSRAAGQRRSRSRNPSRSRSQNRNRSRSRSRTWAEALVEAFEGDDWGLAATVADR